ncbi:MAG: sensor histidine kinase [Pseudomonadota bacterium]
MRSTDPLSLRQRLLLWLLAPILLLTTIWIWAAYAIVLNFANLAYDRALEDTALTLADQVHIEDGVVNVNLPEAARRMVEFDQTDTIHFSISDATGNILVGNKTIPSRPAADNEVHKSRFYDDRIDSHPVRVVEHPIPVDGVPGAVRVRVAETLGKRSVLAREVLIYMMAPQMLFLACIVLLVWHGIGRGIAPLSRIRDAISRRTHEDLSPLDQSGLPSEVHEQVRVINELMARLGQTIDAQRRFIADATHQLRTPITVLRTQIELAMRMTDPDELHAYLSQLDAASARLARLTNQLLNLSRAEAGMYAALEFTPVNVTEWVEDVVAALVPAALAAHIDIRVDIADDLPDLSGDRTLLAEMLANLVDNAIRYTPDGGRVEVRACASGPHVVISVTDDGPGISKEERWRVLGRFHRGALTRGEGSGLGLTIANEIVALHKGRLELDDTIRGSGLCATVRLPCAPTTTR